MNHIYFRPGYTGVYSRLPGQKINVIHMIPICSTHLTFTIRCRGKVSEPTKFTLRAEGKAPLKRFIESFPWTSCLARHAEMPLCSPLPCGRANVIVGCVSDRKRSPKLLCNSTLSLSMHILPLFWLRSAASYIAAWRPYQPFFLHGERGAYTWEIKKFVCKF